jgi:hypothetical protein
VNTTATLRSLYERRERYLLELEDEPAGLPETAKRIRTRLLLGAIEQLIVRIETITPDRPARPL